MTEEKKVEEKDWSYWYKKIKGGVDIYNFIKGDKKKKKEEASPIKPLPLPENGPQPEVPKNLSLGLKTLLIIGTVVVVAAATAIRCASS